MKKFILVIVYCFMSCSLLIPEDLTVFKQGRNSIFAIKPSKKTVDVLIISPYMFPSFQLRSFHQDTLSINAMYYAGCRDWHNKACFLNIQNGNIVEFIPYKFNMRDYSVSSSYHITDNLWLISLTGPELSKRTIFFDIKKNKIIDYKIKSSVSKLPFKNFTERNAWLKKMTSQKSVMDILGSIDPTIDSSDFIALMYDEYFLFKKDGQLVLYYKRNDEENLKFIADLSKFNSILKIDWDIATMAVGSFDYPVISDFNKNELVKDQIITDSVILRNEAVKMILLLLNQNLSTNLLFQFANGDLHQFVEHHLREKANKFVLEESFESLINNERLRICLKIELQSNSGTLSCLSFCVRVED